MGGGEGNGELEEHIDLCCFLPDKQKRLRGSGPFIVGDKSNEISHLYLLI